MARAQPVPTVPREATAHRGYANQRLPAAMTATAAHMVWSVIMATAPIQIHAVQTTPAPKACNAQPTTTRQPAYRKAQDNAVAMNNAQPTNTATYLVPRALQDAGQQIAQSVSTATSNTSVFQAPVQKSATIVLITINVQAERHAHIMTLLPA
mgnify:CR=1 FL=1